MILSSIVYLGSKKVLFMNKPLSCIELFESVLLKWSRYGVFLLILIPCLLRFPSIQNIRTIMYV